MIVMHMSGAYLPQNFFMKKEVIELDCRNIQGTNCYLDDEAKDELRQRIAPCGAEDVHFLDSGNYHYLSLLWLEKIEKPFSLVLFDHHPDMQPPSFGQITSCGGWVLEALETLPHLQRVYMVGVDEKLFCQLESHPKVQLGLDGIVEDANPVYVSFDKDVLSKEDAVCDWDQGEMTLKGALDILGQIKEKHSFIGMDVCGEDSKWQESVTEEKTIAINETTNGILLEFWENINRIEK